MGTGCTDINQYGKGHGERDTGRYHGDSDPDGRGTNRGRVQKPGSLHPAGISAGCLDGIMEGRMNEINITVSGVNKDPDRRGLAELYMTQITEWFANPEHEQEFQDWKRQREKQRKGA